jgi:hypothetical protein
MMRRQVTRSFPGSPLLGKRSRRAGAVESSTADSLVATTTPPTTAHTSPTLTRTPDES